MLNTLCIFVLVCLFVSAEYRAAYWKRQCKRTVPEIRDKLVQEYRRLIVDIQEVLISHKFLQQDKLASIKNRLYEFTQKVEQPEKTKSIWEL